MPSLPPAFRSPRNLFALIFGFFLAMVFWWFFNSDSSHARPRPSETPELAQPGQLDRIEHALRLARAWHVRSTGRLNTELFQTEEDVVCPSDSHTITRALTPAGPGEVTEEFITTANTLYARENGQPWRSEPDPSPDKCQNGPSAGPQKLIPLLTSVKQVARVTQGPLIKLGDTPCRIWDLSGASNLPFHSICVDEQTNLPVRLQVGGLLIEYSKWNQPALIEPPEMPDPTPQQ
ncbi:MAG TPA: hypothetical protein VJQ82_23770 [Terriglobales bacterium]|nr:hypothetical protein [Terriglobales bacterium]